MHRNMINIMMLSCFTKEEMWILKKMISAIFNCFFSLVTDTGRPGIGRFFTVPSCSKRLIVRPTDRLRSSQPHIVKRDMFSYSERYAMIYNGAKIIQTNKGCKERRRKRSNMKNLRDINF